ncbi:hypothetical protein BDZ90DRAFT_186537 [Jaminaea rosea]|uniref:DH domain-containing protein n=1 Tax=Jaminaea rosea TaxID=1569628 RepID=A0A316UPB5_9BASI|nr:hypothetical protein BDZ90DRAFT_186537 [Jaminaea rosea]PWN27120.1 hypothetical protein BDZ90DRAFT_186537 [Jaminaea rosea]
MAPTPSLFGAMDLTATPRPNTTALKEDKSLPPPPLEEILMERQEQMRMQRCSRNDLDGGAMTSEPSSAGSTSVSSHSGTGSPVQSFQTPQLWPAASSSSPTLPDQGTLAPAFDPSVMRMTEATGSMTLARRRRNGSSGAASLSSPTLPDPATFPIPPSPATSLRHQEATATSDVASTTSGHNSSARASSLWSMSNRFSRNGSWDTHHSSPMTTPSSSRDCNMFGKGEGNKAGDREDDEDDVGLGIYSQPSETAAGGGGAETADRWAHHRNPVWTRKPAPLTQHIVSSTPSEHSSTKPPADEVEQVREGTTPIIAPRPTLGRMVSEPNLTDSLISTTSTASVAGPLLPPCAIPSRGASRNRTRSDASPSGAAISVRRRPSKASTTTSSSSSSSMPMSSEDGSFAVLARTVSPRGSSLRTTTRSHKPPSSKAGSAGMKTSTSLSKLASSATLHRRLDSRSSLRELDEGMPTSLTSSSSSTSMMSTSSESRAYNNRKRAMSAASSIASSSRLSIDVKALGMEFPHLTAVNGIEESVGDAVKVVEEGRGVVIEANGRSLADIEYEIGSETSHLLLSGCEGGEEMTAFLERTLPSAAHSLLVLDISHTGIVDLPPCIEQCNRLEELNVSGNALASGKLPSWIGSLSTLRVLIADDTGLVSLPHAMSKLSELTTLSLGHNHLAHLPSWLCLLSGKLERLYLEGNPFKGAWQKLLASIFPSQVPAPAVPISAPAGPFRKESGSSSPSSPASERRPGFSRKKSDNELAKFFNPRVSQQSSQVTTPQQEQDQPVKLTAIEEQMQRRGLLDRDATVKASKGSEGGESKWAFLRKVTRKTSSNFLSNSASASAAASESGRGAGAENSGIASPARSRRPSIDVTQHRSPKTLPRLHTSNASLSRPMDHDAPPATAPAGLLAAFEPTPRSVSTPEERRGLAPPQSQSKRRSFLDFNRVEAPREDPLELKGRMHALMCYLRDLDDLAPASQARRRRAASSARNSDGSLSSYGADHVGNGGTDSPIRLRHPSNQLLNMTSTSSPAPSDIKDDSRRRRRIIAEIISSEESYIRGLQELCDIYVKPAKLPDEKSNGVPILTPQDHRAVFGNVEGLLQFHTGAFLPSLMAAADVVLRQQEEGGDDESEEARCLTAGAAEAVADVFLRHSGWFRMYSAYINGCDQAQTKLASWLAPSQTSSAAAAFRSAASNATGGGGAAGELLRVKRIKTFLKRCRLDPRHTQLSVESYLLLPVQRIPRYELLLKDLARSTDSKRLSNSEAVTSALAQMSSIAASVNESKRQSEQDRKLLAWQSRLRTGWHTPLVQPHRRLLRDGTLQLRRVVQRVKAFDDDAAAAADGDAADASCDGAYGEGGMQVDCLEQHTVGKPITLLLCNDVCVAVTAEGGANSAASSAVDLFALLKPRHTGSGDGSTSSPCCQVMGQTYLRLVDAQRILYFITRTHAEAVEWCEAINDVATRNGSGALRRGS